jgi:hypothetical protein
MVNFNTTPDLSTFFADMALQQPFAFNGQKVIIGSLVEYTAFLD